MAQTEPGEANDAAFGYYTRLARVREHLVRNIGRPLSAAEAAQVADLSPNYFSTYFRQRVGTSFTRWAHGVRVACALELLRSSDLAIGEVAGRVGYRDLRTFERAFKRVTGTNPRRYRARARPVAAWSSGRTGGADEGPRARRRPDEAAS